MLNRQVYRREILRVEHPQLEMVRSTQPISEFHSAKKLFGDRKNRLSPEFNFGESKIHLANESFDSQRKQPKSMAFINPSATKPENTSHYLIHPIRSDTQAGESDRLRLLKEELRRRNEEIRRLLQHKDFTVPQKPQFAVALTPVPKATSVSEPFAKAKSVTPTKTRNETIGAPLGSYKSGDLGTPALRAGVWRGKKPMDVYTADSPTGRLPPHDSESERRKGFADCGTLQLSPFRSRHV